MIKKKKEFSNNNTIFFKVNDVIKVRYFCVSKVSRKLFSIVGLCISVSLKHNSFIVQNIFSGEQINLTFPIFSPYIIQILKLKNYNFNFKQSKLYFKKYFQLKEPLYIKKNMEKQNSKFEPINFIVEHDISNIKIRALKTKFRI